MAIDGDAHGLPQPAATLARRRADDGVLHVEADVEDGGLDADVEAHAVRLHGRRQPTALDHRVEALLDDAAVVVVALDELVKLRNVLALAVEGHAIDEGQAPTGVGGIDTAFGDVLGVNLGRKEGAGCIAVCGRGSVPKLVARKAETILLLVKCKTEGTGADGMIGKA